MWPVFVTSSNGSCERLERSCDSGPKRVLREAGNRLTASEDHSISYTWFCPGESLVERRNRAEQRREELLHLLYEDVNVDTDKIVDSPIADHIEEIVREWMSLVVERDKLLHQQFNKENCVEYFKDLTRLLRDQPSLGDGSEEVYIRETLVELERCVTRYCTKKNIVISPKKRIPVSNVFSKPIFFHSPPPQVLSSIHDTRRHPLEQETGQKSNEEAANIEEDSTSDSQTKPKKPLVPVKEEHLKFHIPFASNSLSNSSHPSVKNKNKSVTVPAISKPSDPDKSQASKIPKLPPPPVLTPPPVPPAPTFTPKIPANPNHRYSGALGTIQFAGVSSNKTPRQGVNGLPGKKPVRQTSAYKTDTIRNRSSVSPGDRKDLMEQITTVGQTILKPTDRPKSPGGTPVRSNSNHLTQDDNTDTSIFRHALISKFRSLHSTPIPSSNNIFQQDYSGSFDFSNAWSDKNCSLVFDDPDISTDSTISASNPNQHSKNSDLIIAQADHNGSTAV